MQRVRKPPRELVEYSSLKLFPASARRLQLRTRRVHYKGGPEWFYVIQELGSLLHDIMAGIIAAYLFERLRRPKGDKIVVTDVLERIAEEDIVRYEQVLRKAEVVSGAHSSSAPKATITIIEKHRAIASALSDRDAADKLFVPILEDAARSTKKARGAFLSRYAKLAARQQWNRTRDMSESDDKPSAVDIARFNLEISRQHLQYRKFIRTRGFQVDEAEISRLESELAQEEARFDELFKRTSDEQKA
jgi:hypothetical protein